MGHEENITVSLAEMPLGVDTKHFFYSLLPCWGRARIQHPDAAQVVLLAHIFAAQETNDNWGDLSYVSGCIRFSIPPVSIY